MQTNTASLTALLPGVYAFVVSDHVVRSPEAKSILRTGPFCGGLVGVCSTGEGVVPEDKLVSGLGPKK